MKFCTHVFRVHSETWHPAGFSSLCSAEYVWSEDVQILQLVLQPNSHAKKNTLGEVLVVLEDVCNISQSDVKNGVEFRRGKKKNV